MALGVVSQSFHRPINRHALTTIDGMPAVGVMQVAPLFVNGNLTGGDGSSITQGTATIQAAVNAAVPYQTIYILPKTIPVGATDPVSYAETIIIPNTLPGLRLIGVSDGPAQGNVPQIKKGSGAVALLTVRAPGVVIDGLGFNGGGSTGGGILLDDNGTTKVAFGAIIQNCHFKNCVGTTATDGRTGGAIMWSSAGGPWQCIVRNNSFYKNVADIVLLGTSNAVPQDLYIYGNKFSGPSASVDVNIYFAAGSGANGIYIDQNIFPAFPAIGSGSVLLFFNLTGCIGSLTNNLFGSTGKTFDADDGTGGLAPTTVLMVENYQEGSVSGGGTVGLINRDSA